VKHLYEWELFTPEVVAKLQSEGRSMADFTADWCLTCQWNFQRAMCTR
jgi:thiol:disulfide interchange protein